MQHNFCFRHLVVIETKGSIVNMQASPKLHVVSIYKYGKTKFEQAFLVLKLSKILSRQWEMPHLEND